MLSGIYLPEGGIIYVNEHPQMIRCPKDAYNLGIGMIHQHFKLVDVLTAAENIVLGLNEHKLVDLKNVRSQVKEICDRYGFVVEPDKKVYDMSVSEKQTLEIVKVLYRGADILILDEPTAVLTPQETEKLFAVMRNMKADGKSIVIITHKLHEVMEISDRVAVLRRGKFIGDIATKDTNPQQLTDMMVGRAVSLNIDRPEPKNPVERLVVKDLTVLDSDWYQARWTKYHLPLLEEKSLESQASQAAASVNCSNPSRACSILRKAVPFDSCRRAAPRSSLVGKNPLDIYKLGVGLAFVPEGSLRHGPSRLDGSDG